MKKFIQDLGYKYTDNNDLDNREFRHVDTNFEYDEELSTMGNPRHLITSEWQISLKDYNPVLFESRLRNMYDNIAKGVVYKLLTTTDNYLVTSSDDSILTFKGDRKKVTSKDVFYYNKSMSDEGEFFIESYSVDTEKDENRTLINLTFIIRGN